MNQPSRSLSINLVAIVQGFVSLSSMASGIFLLLLLTGTIQVFSQDLQGLSLPLKGLIILGFIISSFGLVATYGLWRLRPWGWICSVVFQGLCIANNGLTVLAGQELATKIYFAIAICLAQMAVLFLPSVRNLFGWRSVEPGSLA